MKGAPHFSLLSEREGLSRKASWIVTFGKDGNEVKQNLTDGNLVAGENLIKGQDRYVQLQRFLVKYMHYTPAISHAFTVKPHTALENSNAAGIA